MISSSHPPAPANEQPLRFTTDLLSQPFTRAVDARARLAHFAIISYAVDPQRVRSYVDERFELDCFTGSDNTPKVWVSMVPFEDQDFHFLGLPWFKFRFGQTNYRTYVIDRRTGQRSVWFFGTTLDSWTVVLPRYVWRLPWHPGRIRFACEYDTSQRRYLSYHMHTASNWAPVTLKLEDSGQPVTALEGFADLESGLVRLTHPLLGAYYRRGAAQQLGSYHVWHDRLNCTRGSVIQARIGLFDRLGIVPFAEQSQPHSVLIQPSTEFTIYLPPTRIPQDQPNKGK